MRLFLLTLVFGGFTAAGAALHGQDVSPDVHSLYAQGTEFQSISGSSVSPIKHLKFTLPPASPHRQFALVTFTTASLKTTGIICVVAIVAGSTEYAVGYSTGATPMALATRVPLTAERQTVHVDWHIYQGQPSSFCGLITEANGQPFYSLSAILTAD